MYLTFLKYGFHLRFCFLKEESSNAQISASHTIKIFDYSFSPLYEGGLAKSSHQRGWDQEPFISSSPQTALES